jgi:hypothetical protein
MYASGASTPILIMSPCCNSNSLNPQLTNSHMSNYRKAFDVVQAQLDAYNTRNIDAFLDLFHEDIEISELGSKTSPIIGKVAIEARYKDLFANSPGLHSDVVNRTVFGHVVIDLEHITGRNGSVEPYRILAIYEVELGLIKRVHFVRPES